MLAANARAAGPSADDPLSAKPAHFPARAKRVAFLFMHGGVSHVDSFDPKPKLAEMNGQPLPIAKPKFEFAPTGNLLASPWKFQKYGESGIEVSELFPQIGERIDDVSVIFSMNGGDQVSHGPARLNINTGSGVFARPCLGARPGRRPGLAAPAARFVGATQSSTLGRGWRRLATRRTDRGVRDGVSNAGRGARRDVDLGRETAATRAAYGVDVEPTNEFGYHVAEDKVTMPDFHATILHLLGLDHERLTFRHAGRDDRLTDVAGQVISKIVS